MKKLAKHALFALAVVSATACFNEKKVYNRSTVSEKHGKMLLGRQTRRTMNTTRRPSKNFKKRT